MKILHIITQKPLATGSGTYLTGLMRAMDNLGHSQYLIFGINKGDRAELPLFFNKFISNAVVFDGEDLKYPITGMSDVMPYKNTLYKDLSRKDRDDLRNIFIDKLKEALGEFKPDMVLCQHLYLVTSWVSSFIKKHHPSIPVFGICHGTDLRQLGNIEETRSEILKGLNDLSSLFFLHEGQIGDYINLNNMEGFNPQVSKLKVMGSGYDSFIFNEVHKKDYIMKKKSGENSMGVNNKKLFNIVYTGKLCRAKGVIELFEALNKVSEKYPIKLTLIGSTGTLEEMNTISELSAKVNFKSEFMGLLKQEDIVKIYSSSDVFVLPSYFEGLPLVSVEALASGLPVVITKLPGIEEWLRDYKKFIFFVEKPKMENIDTPTSSGRESFINDLNSKIIEAIEYTENRVFEPIKEIKKMDWQGLSERILKEYSRFLKF